ncbi:MAG: hypothetical protein JXR76_03410 [Deltaproteobacteria bacterium]|nr:hypothetical protein [Deltaproteobacteria bacterium]
MKNTNAFFIVSLFITFIFSTLAHAQMDAAASADGAVELDASLLDGIGSSATVQTEVAKAQQATPENTLAACKDNADNDGDSYTDCADQDCSIFAICASQPPGTATKQPSASQQTDTVEIFERGRLCKDGLDNDKDGQIDCHDTECQTTRYCQKVMYEYPNTPYRAPGVFFQAGMGLALPSFNWKDVRTNSVYGNRVPFDPDMGVMLNFKMGLAPIAWIGFGMNVNMGGTFASNRSEFISITDLDTKYKYDGYKLFGHIGGFIRLQYPAKRVTVYMDIAGGSSFARYKWRVYDGQESWDDISGDWENDWEDDDDNVPHDTRYKQDHHFSLVLEPGFDFFVVERKVGIGMHAWLPVYASSYRGMDNIGVMFNATFTPSWREPRRLKEEYK